MSRTSDLYRLQSLDCDLAKNRKRLEEIEQILSNSTERMTATAALEEADSALKEVRSSHSRAEHDVESQRSKLKHNETLLYGGGVTNPKELEDLQKENLSLRKHLSTLEDRLLEAMIELETHEERFGQAQETLDQVEQSLETQHLDLTNEKKGLLDAVARLSEDRTSMAGKIVPEDLSLYTKLQEEYGNRVISRLEDDSCGVCGLQLARSVLQEARNSNTISRCPQCGRILFAAG